MNKKHILVIDDELLILNVVSEALARKGFIVTPVNDSVEALDMIINNNQKLYPVDLIMTDHNMPNLDGLAFFDILNDKGIQLPLLLMSGNHDETLELEAMSRGCIGFVKKPFPIFDVIDQISLFLENSLERNFIRV